MEVPHFLEGSNKILAVTITILQRYLGLFSFALLHVYVYTCVRNKALNFLLPTDPWLKRANVKKDKKKKKKKAKQKKAKKKKSKKTHDASDLDSDIDDQFDKALEAAGLKASSENSNNPFNHFTSMYDFTSTWHLW